MTRQQLERLAQALRTIGDGFHLAASTLLEVKDTDSGDADGIHVEAFVDQRTPLAPRDLYLRLAREGAFPSRKVGKLVVAQWGDVRAALRADGGSVQQVNGHDDHDDDLRRSLGLRPKGST